MDALIDIQSRLKAPKNQYNKFGNYKYRSCEDILLAVKPLLAEYNCVLTLTDDIVVAGDRFYVKATATLRNKDGKEISVSAFAREAAKGKNGMDDSQVTGCASSYARKYALNGLFCIDDTNDADATNTHDKDDSVSDDICEKAREFLRGNANSCNKLLAYYNKSSIEELNRSELEAIYKQAKDKNYIK